MSLGERFARTLGGVLLAFFSQLASAAGCTGTVYLTFTPGNMAQAETIARILRQEAVPATFFLANEPTFRGDRALDPAWRDYWRGLVADGHAFGNHTFQHLYFKRELPNDKLQATIDHHGPEITLDAQALCVDLRQTEEAFHALTGERLQGMWRPPGTTVPQRTVRWAAGCGWPRLVAWDVRGFYGDELPSDKYPNDRLLKQALKNFGSGTIIMMHLGVKSRKDPLAPTLAPLIQGLKARGLCFAPLAAPPH